MLLHHHGGRAALRHVGGHRHGHFFRSLGRLARRAAPFFPGSGFATALDILGDPGKAHAHGAHKTHAHHAAKHGHGRHHGGGIMGAIGSGIGAGLSDTAHDVLGGAGEVSQGGPAGMMAMLTHGAHPSLLPGMRRHRRINWANPRALGRAERRLGSFIHHFTKTAKFLGMHVSRAPRRHRRGAFPRRRK